MQVQIVVACPTHREAIGTRSKTLGPQWAYEDRRTEAIYPHHLHMSYLFHSEFPSVLLRAPRGRPRGWT